MDLATRSKREKEILAAILLLFQDETLLFSPGQLQSRLQATLAEHYETVYVEAAEQLAGRQLPDESSVRDRARKWAAKQAAETASDFVKNSRNMMADEVTEEDLAKIFGESRAENLAITETTRAATEGMEDTAAALMSAGIIVGKAIWNTAEDSKVCPVCRPLNGRDRSFWSQFTSSGPPAHPRCRCYLVYS